MTVVHDWVTTKKDSSLHSEWHIDSSGQPPNRYVYVKELLRLSVCFLFLMYVYITVVCSTWIIMMGVRMTEAV